MFKIKAGISIIIERNINETIVILKKGISQDDLKVLVALEDVIRKQEVDKSLGYDLNKKEDIHNLLIENPKALERPILIKNGNAIIGRPPENILVLLD